jgi:hypothetical protein
MFTVTLRFYGTLNDFFPQTQHNQTILQERSHFERMIVFGGDFAPGIVKLTSLAG